MKKRHEGPSEGVYTIEHMRLREAIYDTAHKLRNENTPKEVLRLLAELEPLMRKLKAICS